MIKLNLIYFKVNIIPGAKENVYGYNDLTGQIVYATEAEEVELANFKCENCEVEFCYDYELKDKTFSLIYDSEKEFEDDCEEWNPTPEHEVIPA